MRKAVIENDIIVNVVKADADWQDPRGRETIEFDPSQHAIGYVRRKDGEKGFKAPPKPPMTWQEIRNERNKLLRETDWAVLPDTPIDKNELDEIKSYRRSLRDIPQNFDNTENIEWPEKPNYQ